MPSSSHHHHHHHHSTKSRDDSSGTDDSSGDDHHTTRSSRRHLSNKDHRNNKSRRHRSLSRGRHNKSHRKSKSPYRSKSQPRVGLEGGKNNPGSAKSLKSMPSSPHKSNNHRSGHHHHRHHHRRDHHHKRSHSLGRSRSPKHGSGGEFNSKLYISNSSSSSKLLHESSGELSAKSTNNNRSDDEAFSANATLDMFGETPRSMRIIAKRRSSWPHTNKVRRHSPNAISDVVETKRRGGRRPGRTKSPVPGAQKSSVDQESSPKHGSGGEVNSKLYIGNSNSSSSKLLHGSSGELSAKSNNSSSRLRHRSDDAFSASTALDMSGEIRSTRIAKEDLGGGLTQGSDTLQDSSAKASDAETKRRARRPGRSRSPVPGAQKSVGGRRGAKSPRSREKFANKFQSHSRATRPGAEDVSSPGGNNTRTKGVAVGVESKSSPGGKGSSKKARRGESHHHSRSPRRRMNAVRDQGLEDEIHVEPDANGANASSSTPTQTLEPLSASNDLPLAAVAVDDTANEERFDERVQEAVGRMMQNTKGEVAVAESMDSRVNDNSRAIRRMFLLVLVLVLFVGGGLATFILMRKGNTNRPVPSSAKPGLGYAPPSEEDCQAVRAQKSVAGQDEMVKIRLVITIEVVLSKEEDFDVYFSTLVTAIQETLVPELAGCTVQPNRRGLEQLEPIRFLRRKLEVDTAPPYPIANANVTVEEKIGESCSTNVSERCRLASLNLELSVRDGADASGIMPIVRDVLEVDGSQPLVGKLELSDAGFEDIKFVGEEETDPLNEPTSTPSGSDSDPLNESTSTPTSSPSDALSITPSTFSSDVPSETPTRASVVDPTTEEPTRSPASRPVTARPIPSPTLQPTPLVTLESTSPGPTPPPTPFPSSLPTPPPSAGPTQAPTPAPSNQPSSSPSTLNSPSKWPSFSPSESPSSSPSQAPSSNPSQSPSIRPSGSPSSTPSTSPSKWPSFSPSQNPSSSPSQNPSFSPTKILSDSPSSSPSQSSSSSSPVNGPSTGSPT